MRIGIDAMGGDFAPRTVVEGTILSASWRAKDERVVLFGKRDDLLREFASLGASIEGKNVEIVDCSEVIDMHDHPMRAISQKKDSSIVVGFHHLAQGKVEGFASAGNTGAMMAGTMTHIKVVEGLSRPSIATSIPMIDGSSCLLLDVGLNSDCKPEVLLQYGLLGSLYSQIIHGVQKPRVALLNIGAEPEKGNLLSRATYELMSATKHFYFAGNIEGNEIFSGEKADVIVCDGFVGNIVLKEAEALYHLACAKGLGDDSFFSRFNFENYGGIPVLGVNAPVIIGHGVSNGKAINMMIKQTVEVIASQLCEKIKSAFKNV